MSAQCRSSSTRTRGWRLGGVLQERRDAVEEAEARLLRLRAPAAAAGREGAREPPRRPGRCRRRPAPSPRAAPPGRGSCDVGADRLHPRPVRRRALALVAAAPQHLRAAQARVRGELLRGARLADARLADEHHQRGRGPRAPPRSAARSSSHLRLAGRRRRRRPGGRAGSPRSASPLGDGGRRRSRCACQRLAHRGGARRGARPASFASSRRISASSGSRHVRGCARTGRPAAC